MKKLSILIFIFCKSALYSQTIENIQIHSKELNQDREILVYTPPGYNELTLQTYDVIYVFDAQNRELFDFTHAMIRFLDPEQNFIVVGITSPNHPETNYNRQNDFLPIPVNVAPEDFFGGRKGNVDHFLKYLKNEVAPYIEKNYRTKGRKIAVGHSLGASFILWSLVEEPALFNDYIAVSPNLAFDKERLVNELMNIDYENRKSETFLYLSHADEGIEYWREWLPAREKFYAFLRVGHWTNFQYLIKDFSDETHWSSFPPSLTAAFKAYVAFIEERDKKYSKEIYEISISVKVPNKTNEVYIVGNQPELGDWQADKIKLNRKSDFLREIQLKVHSPAIFKFTRGNWETEGTVKFHDGSNLYIHPEKQNQLEFEIEEWADN
ncbi:MAG: hypothetical protein LBN18_07255 [Dysgonamonadaceae bacterium]|jgi:predicted alpha/beta superfamily hydrolase|nr:hypothetical protein [Dysgonamonadaceae bacterium]